MRSGQGHKVRPQPKGKASLFGILLIVSGSLLLIVIGTYYGYATFARSQLDELTFSPGDPSVPQQERADALASGFLSLYSGDKTNAKYWNAPLWAGTDPYEPTGLPEGFEPVDSRYAPVAVGTLPSAERIQIPIIGVDSTVRDLAVVDLGDSRAYETPKNIVGHIPGTANPGEEANGWFFGHLESPLAGEGNVFQDLPKIPQFLRQGDRVFVMLKREDTTYLYEVSATRVVHKSELQLYTSQQPTVTLVTCVPRMVYDHRLLITAELVGTKASPIADLGLELSFYSDLP